MPASTKRRGHSVHAQVEVELVLLGGGAHEAAGHVAHAARIAQEREDAKVALGEVDGLAEGRRGEGDVLVDLLADGRLACGGQGAPVDCLRFAAKALEDAAPANRWR